MPSLTPSTVARQAVSSDNNVGCRVRHPSGLGNKVNCVGEGQHLFTCKIPRDVREENMNTKSTGTEIIMTVLAMTNSNLHALRKRTISSIQNLLSIFYSIFSSSYD